jgi:hypothetical protein
MERQQAIARDSTLRDMLAQRTNLLRKLTALDTRIQMFVDGKIGCEEARRDDIALDTQIYGSLGDEPRD